MINFCENCLVKSMCKEACESVDKQAHKLNKMLWSDTIKRSKRFSKNFMNSYFKYIKNRKL